MTSRVIAIHIGGDYDDPKHPDVLGPFTLTEENRARFARWEKWHLELHGGYVHFLPADDDITEADWAEEMEMVDAEKAV